MLGKGGGGTLTNQHFQEQLGMTHMRFSLFSHQRLSVKINLQVLWRCDWAKRMPVAITRCKKGEGWSIKKKCNRGKYKRRLFMLISGGTRPGRGPLSVLLVRCCRNAERFCLADFFLFFSQAVRSREKRIFCFTDARRAAHPSICVCQGRWRKTAQLGKSLHDSISCSGSCKSISRTHTWRGAHVLFKCARSWGQIAGQEVQLQSHYTSVSLFMKWLYVRTAPGDGLYRGHEIIR